MTQNNQKQCTFWSKQPVSANSTNMVFSRIINNDLKKVDTSALNALVFSEIDTTDDKQLGELTEFLNNNYYETKIESVTANSILSTKKYTMSFSNDLTKFVIGSHGYTLGLRLKYNNILVGVISGHHQKYQLKTKIEDLVDVTLFCIDKRLRTKMAGTKLMTEFYNNQIEKGVKLGIFTTNKQVAMPCSKISVYKRPLTPEKLNSMGYFDVKDKSILEKLLDKYTIIRKLPSNIVKFKDDMMPKIYELYTEYMDKFDLHAIYTIDELKSILTSKLMSTYVIYDKKKQGSNNIIDFFSFYTFDSVADKKVIKSGRLFLHTTISDEITTRRLTEYASIAAYGEGLDLLYLTNTLELGEVLSDIDNNYAFDSDYYVNMYNWEIPVMKPEQISRFVLLN